MCYCLEYSERLQEGTAERMKKAKKEQMRLIRCYYRYYRYFHCCFWLDYCRYCYFYFHLQGKQIVKCLEHRNPNSGGEHSQFEIHVAQLPSTQ